jgi:hypothetical protein
MKEDPDENPLDEDCWDRGCDGYACRFCPFMPKEDEKDDEIENRGEL